MNPEDRLHNLYLDARDATAFLDHACRHGMDNERALVQLVKARATIDNCINHLARRRQ